ncbi:hypothetical protein ABT096_29695 [Streptomyces sp. NPDC002561]|uniref:hypothetical protein n=1 Tax=Streptomyces sp. NPDC002561 TaxID=3154418 RepID=UPI00332389E5
MSARDELFKHANDMAKSLCGEFCGGGTHTCPEDDAAEINRLIDNFAHELAERQRDAVNAAERRGLKLSPRYVIGLIDPEVAK